MVELSSCALGKSLAALKLAIEHHQHYREGRLYVITQNSLIPAFEICFGQYKPALQRWFAEIEGLSPSSVDEMSFATVIRTANELGIPTQLSSSG